MAAAVAVAPITGGVGCCAGAVAAARGACLAAAAAARGACLAAKSMETELGAGDCGGEAFRSGVAVLVDSGRPRLASLELPGPVPLDAAASDGEDVACPISDEGGAVEDVAPGSSEATFDSNTL